MENKKQNGAKWSDESRAIIESNGEIKPCNKKYHINCTMNITPEAAMTQTELRTLVHYCNAIAESYKECAKYIYPTN